MLFDISRCRIACTNFLVLISLFFSTWEDCLNLIKTSLGRETSRFKKQIVDKYYYEGLYHGNMKITPEMSKAQ